MLILGKNKDYYDGVVGTMGVDKTIIYNRVMVEYENDKIPKIFKGSNYSYYFRNNSNFIGLSNNFNISKYTKYTSYSYFIVGFCGKLYLGLKLYYKVKVGLIDELETTITYDLDYIKSTIMERDIDELISKIINYNAIELFREYDTPIFIFDSEQLKLRGRKIFIVNPMLKDYEFYKVFDTFQAFQEIQMFIGGVLGSKENETIIISDKDKIMQHGFDFKWSFRKEKK